MTTFTMVVSVLRASRGGHAAAAQVLLLTAAGGPATLLAFGGMGEKAFQLILPPTVSQLQGLLSDEEMRSTALSVHVLDPLGSKAVSAAYR